MVLINIDQLTDSELRYIASQENLDNWESLSREDLIETLEELYDEDYATHSQDNSKKFVKSLTDVNSDVLQLPGVEPLPENFSTNEIHFILMDANWAYSFWSFDNIQSKKIKENNSQIIIRVEEKTSQSDFGESFEITVSLADNNWNIELPKKGIEYRLSLIIKDNGNIEKIAESETIKTPDSWIAHNSDILDNQDRYKILVPSLISKEGEIIGNRQVREILSSHIRETLI